MSGARRSTSPVFVVAALLAGATFAACRSGRTGDVPAGPPQAPAALRVQLAKLRAQSDVLLDGGPKAFRARLAALRGTPIVVNQWASWCGPCRYEFPFFQHLSARYAGRVAFLGVDSQDNRSAAERFLKRFPVPYPHYYDENAAIARTFRGGQAWPTTAFYGRDGRLAFTHIGAYATEAKLDGDIRRYVLHG